MAKANSISEAIFGKRPGARSYLDSQVFMVFIAPTADAPQSAWMKLPVLAENADMAKSLAAEKYPNMAPVAHFSLESLKADAALDIPADKADSIRWLEEYKEANSR